MRQTPPGDQAHVTWNDPEEEDRVVGGDGVGLGVELKATGILLLRPARIVLSGF